MTWYYDHKLGRRWRGRRSVREVALAYGVKESTVHAVIKKLAQEDGDTRREEAIVLPTTKAGWRRRRHWEWYLETQTDRPPYRPRPVREVANLHGVGLSTVYDAIVWVEETLAFARDLLITERHLDPEARLAIGG